MAEFGFRTSFYAQEELMKKIDAIVQLHPGTFKSRSHFINAAINRQLLYLKEHPPEIETE